LHARCSALSAEISRLNASVNNPNPNIDFSPFLSLAGMTAPTPHNTYPYNEKPFGVCGELS
jgi:hypothetical protein